MKPEKIEVSNPADTKEEKELEDWQFLLAIGIKVGCGYEFLKMIRKDRDYDQSENT